MKKTYDMPEKEISPGTIQLFLPIYFQHPVAMKLKAEGIQLCGITLATPGFRLRRTPNFHLLLYTVEGDGWFGNGKKLFPLSPGSLVFTPAFSEHLYFQEGERPWRFLWFHLLETERWAFIRSCSFACNSCRDTLALEAAMKCFSAEMLALQQKDFDSARQVLLYADSTGLKKETEQFQLRPGGGLFAAELADRAADSILFYLERDLRELLNCEMKTPVQMTLDRLWTKIAETLDRPWTLADMAAAANLSIPTLIRHMRRTFQGTPGEILQHIRLRHAAHLLDSTRVPIKEIAALAGYSSTSAFIAAFRRAYRRSPLRYRRENGMDGQ